MADSVDRPPPLIPPSPQQREGGSGAKDKGIGIEDKGGTFEQIPPDKGAHSNIPPKVLGEYKSSRWSGDQS